MQQYSDEPPLGPQATGRAADVRAPHEAARPPVEPDALPTRGAETSYPPRHFCGKCGTAWDPAWTGCPACAARAAIRTDIPRREAGSVKSALALYFVLLSTSFLTAAIIVVTGDRDDVAFTVQATMDLVNATIVAIWVLVLRRNVLDGLRRLRPGWCFGAAAMAVPTMLLASTVVAILVRVLGAAHINYGESIRAAGHGLGAIVLMVCVQPAVVEELAFRGVILSALRDALSDREAIVVSAMMFMIIHCSVLSLPHLLTLGLVLAWLRVRTGSLWPGMVLHFSHNFLVILSEAFGVLQP